MRAAVVDERLVHLLHDCEKYLARQRMLLLRAAACGFPEGAITAMDAAMDQFAAGVTSARKPAPAEDAESSERPGYGGTGSHVHRPPNPPHGDPGQ